MSIDPLVGEVIAFALVGVIVSGVGTAASVHRRRHAEPEVEER